MRGFEEIKGACLTSWNRSEGGYWNLALLTFNTVGTEKQIWLWRKKIISPNYLIVVSNYPLGVHGLPETKLLSNKGLLRRKQILFNNRNILDISLSLKQRREFILVSIGKKVSQSALCVWGLSLISSSHVLSNGKFAGKNRLLVIKFPHV